MSTLLRIISVMAAIDAVSMLRTTERSLRDSGQKNAADTLDCAVEVLAEVWELNKLKNLLDE